MPQIALYQPEIAGNVGTIIRNCACFDADLHIIEPCGFPFDKNRIKKSALDYFDHVKITRHNSFDDFSNYAKGQGAKIILATTKTDQNYQNFPFSGNEIILFGQESAGVPENIANKCDEKITIPMQTQMRSLNIAVSCGIILAEAFCR